MAEHSHIEWTDATWNPITGCSVVSPGCTNCYAMRLAGTRMKHHRSRAGLTIDTKAGPVWNGEVRFNKDWLDQPLAWRRPRMIFVCAHGDLFHENVPDDWIDRVFAVMALAPQHTFQVLTKRPERMRSYLSSPLKLPRIMDIAVLTKRENVAFNWPLPNVWLGVSAEDQARADERVPDLLATPAAIHFVSAEPLLGPVDFTSIDDGLRDGTHLIFDGLTGLAHDGEESITGIFGQPDPRIDWIILGGESGPGARPMHPAWARAIRDQCAAAGVPYFLKQWGEWRPGWYSDSQHTVLWGTGRGMTLGAPPHEPSRVHAWPDGSISVRVGKKRAGALLDGVEHRELPEVRHA